MLNVFTLSNGRLIQEEIENAAELAQFQPVWVDLEDPTDEEKNWVENYYNIVIPRDATDDDIEESARFYKEDNGELHIRSDFLIDDDDPRTERVAFILNLVNPELKSNNILFTIHNEDLPVFRLLRLRARFLPGFIEDARDAMLMLFDADAEYSADALEDVHLELEKVSKTVLKGDISDEVASEVLASIAHEENINGLVRRNAMDSRRAISFIMRSKILSPDQFDDARQILRDIDSLDAHTGFLFDKINFLMDAAVGFINIAQNRIIKMFSVASVAIMPPTLIASIYGMNFHHMPEMKWEYGYPLVLLLMIASAILPVWYFRKRGWL